jgi:hypothetical protein
MLRSTPALALFALSACGGPVTGTMEPHLAFTIGEEVGLTAPRDLTVDATGNVYVFDYDDYLVSKFDPTGEVLATFGGTGEGTEGFQHLMAIRALGDSILALDAGALAVFASSGELLSYTPFADTITCDLPRIHSTGEWAGQWIFDETAEKILTSRGPRGREGSRVARHLLSEFFPGVEPGGFFFLRTTQDRSYLYDFLPQGGLVWAASDQLEVLVRNGSEDVTLFESEGLPIPFPAERVAAMREDQAGLGPPLFMNVPEAYQLIQHLLVDETGDIWLYLMSQERTGFLQLSDQGREVGFFTVDAGFDLLSARIIAAGGRFFFLVEGGDRVEVHVVDRP